MIIGWATRSPAITMTNAARTISIRPTDFSSTDGSVLIISSPLLFLPNHSAALGDHGVLGLSLMGKHFPVREQHRSHDYQTQNKSLLRSFAVSPIIWPLNSLSFVAGKFPGRPDRPFIMHLAMPGTPSHKRSTGQRSPYFNATFPQPMIQTAMIQLEQR